MMVTGDNQIGLAINGALQNPVVIRIGGDDNKLGAGHNNVCNLGNHPDGFVNAVTRSL